MACISLPAFRPCFLVQGQTTYPVLNKNERKGKTFIRGMMIHYAIEALHLIEQTLLRVNLGKQSNTQ